MRYYSLTIQNAAGQVLQVEKSGLGFTWADANQGASFSSTWTSWQTSNKQLVGQANPNALNVYFDLPVAPLHTPQGAALMRIWGLGIKCLGQAADLNPVGKTFNTFTLRAGMSKGLPLANPAQAGIVAQGIIYQAFGNWTGTEQTLDLIIYSGGSSVPVILNWPRGTSLQSALKQLAAQAFPGYTANINISADLVAPSDQGGCYQDAEALAMHLHQYTKWLGAKMYGPNYPGVGMVVLGNSIYASDGEGLVAPKSVALAFQDLVGQPTWIEANSITFQTTLRGDINYNDTVTFPTGIMLPYALTTPNAAAPNAPAASNLTFQDKFVVTEIHYYANFRQADAASWNTTFVATAIPQTTPNYLDTLNLGAGRHA